MMQRLLYPALDAEQMNRIQGPVLSIDSTCEQQSVAKHGICNNRLGGRYDESTFGQRLLYTDEHRCGIDNFLSNRSS